MTDSEVGARAALEYCHTGLRARVLRLHVVQVRPVVLALVVILREAAEVGRARDGRRAEGAAPAEAVALRVRHAWVADAAADDAATVRSARTRVL